jgi:hypothetical protein
VIADSGANRSSTAILAFSLTGIASRGTAGRRLSVAFDAKLGEVYSWVHGSSRAVVGIS